MKETTIVIQDLVRHHAQLLFSKAVLHLLVNMTGNQITAKERTLQTKTYFLIGNVRTKTTIKPLFLMASKVHGVRSAING